LVRVERFRKSALTPSQAQRTGRYRRKIQPLESWKRRAEGVFDCFESASIGLSKIEKARNQVFTVSSREFRGRHRLGQPDRGSGIDIQDVVKS
jgi:hypothetical protein